MTEQTFTESQAKHASSVVLKLMKEHRFFLRKDDRGKNYNMNCDLEPNVFVQALDLDCQIRTAYTKAKTLATKTIMKAEKNLGVTEPDLSGDRQLVRCSRYTGGLDICQVYPLSAFTKYIPDTIEVLTKQLFQQLMYGGTKDNIASKTIRVYRDRANKLAETIWGQLKAVKARSPRNNRCVVMMQSKFSCASYNKNDDFMHDKVCGIQDFPHAMGYLFHAYSMRERIVNHNHVVFSTSRKSHVNVQHWRDKEPTIEYAKERGYNCLVIFVTIL